MTDSIGPGSGAKPPAPGPLAAPVIDTHCHLDMEVDDELLSVDEALSHARSVGVARIVQVGCDIQGSRWAADVAASHDSVVATVALHPNEAPRIAESSGASELTRSIDEIASLATLPRVRAVGETGMDTFRTGNEGRAVQEHSFREHIRIARDVNKPVVIHDRDAHTEVLDVLASEDLPRDVVFHCYSGDAAMARECARAGWYLSFAGTVTFKNASSLRDALLEVPLEQVLVETDAPYLTPMPYRGRPNASYLIPHTVRVMAQVRGESEETLCEALFANAQRVFGAW